MPSPPPQRLVSLETLPVDVARLITLHLHLTDLENLLRTSTAVARLFWISCTEVSFAIIHVRRHLPPPPDPPHTCRATYSCRKCISKFSALSGPDYSALPTSYALAVLKCLGFDRMTFAVVFGDTLQFQFGNGIGPKRNPRWIEDVLVALVRKRMVDHRGAEAVWVMFECATQLDSVELAAAVVEWLCELHMHDQRERSPDAPPHPEVHLAKKLCVAQFAAVAAQRGALAVLAFALDHECEFDPWDLPDPHVPPWNLIKTVNSLPLDKTLLMNVEEEAATRLLLGLPLPLSPLRRAEAVMLPLDGTTRRQCLEAGSRRRVPGLTALQIAAHLGNVGVFDLLVAAGADHAGWGPGHLGRHDLMPLLNNVTARNHAMVSRLLRLDGVDVNKEPGVMEAAVKYGSLEMMTELLEFGAKVDKKGKVLRRALVRILTAFASSVLYEASLKENLAVLELMLRNGGDPNWLIDDRPLLAMLAARNLKKHPVGIRICQILLAHGADVNQRSRDSKAALHFVEDESMAHLLIEYGADVGARDVEGFTPLHRVCERGFEVIGWCLEVARVLLEAGSEVNAVTAEGKTCLDLLPQVRACRELRELLVSYGGIYSSELTGA
ncbi:hypothetical protein HDU96_004908 [Phlyctochytrium bullatum]|nr:hypothetical protein HDU96_004908 [Phlyctochytrium bullatum]